MNYDPNTGQPINNQQPYQPVQQQSQTNGFAIAGLIVSILVSAVIGLILSIVGLSKAKKLNSGKGMAIAGIIISVLKLIAEVLLVLLLGGLFATLFGAAINQETYCSMAYECGEPNEYGYASCKYKSDNGVDITISCPATTTKKTTTTTTSKTNTKDAIVYELDTDSGAPYYVDVFYLKDNNLYGHITDKFPRKIDTDSVINGKNVNLIVKNVKKVFVVEYGQAGYQDVIFVDLINKTYRLFNMEEANKTALSFEEITSATDITNAYSLNANDARDYILVNSKNQIVNTYSKYTYAYFDKKHNLNETLIGSDVIKLVYVKSEIEETTPRYSHNYFEVYVNGTKQDKLFDYYICEDVTSYNDIELIQIPVKKSGSTYVMQD